MSFPPRRILVGTDFSDCAVAAANAAAALAKADGGELVLAHCIPERAGAAVYQHITKAVARPGRERATAQRALEAEAARLAERGVTVGIVLMTGRPAVKMAQLAGQLCFDLIVVGAHRLEGARRLYFGSTAEATVRRSPVPVLTVREPVPAPV